jgi:hypothetical protein
MSAVACLGAERDAATLQFERNSFHCIIAAGHDFGIAAV